LQGWSQALPALHVYPGAKEESILPSDEVSYLLLSALREFLFQKLFKGL